MADLLFRRLACRVGLHRKRLRQGYWADRTFVMVGVNLYECSRPSCGWHTKGIGEGEDLRQVEIPKTWPNGVPYIDEDTRKENLRDPEALRDLIHHLYIHSGYGEHGQVRKMTTEQKELFADVVDEHPRDFEAQPYDRWWHR